MTAYAEGLRFWTDDKIAALRRLASDGLSGAQIAKELCAASRSAVIGKMARLGIPFANDHTRAARLQRRDTQLRAKVERLIPRPRPPKPASTKTTKAQIAERRAAAPITRDRIAFLDATELTDLPAEDASHAVSFFDLADNSCRWPIGDPRSLNTIKFCGKHSGKDRSYCDHHHRIAHRQGGAAT